jgi:hypothetical protein
VSPAPIDVLLRASEAKVYSQQFDLSQIAQNEALGLASAGESYRVLDASGSTVAMGQLDNDGRSQRVFTEGPAQLTLVLGDGQWVVEEGIDIGREESE